MKNGDKPIADPHLVLREEFDDWAVLFNANTGHGFGLNPTGVCLWKLLHGGHSIDHLVKALQRDTLDVPQNVRCDVGAFVDALVAEGLATFESNEYLLSGTVDREELSSSQPEHGSEVQPFTYEPPKLVDFTGERASGNCCCTPGSSQISGCGNGALTSYYCSNGTCASCSDCSGGTNAGTCACTGSSADSHTCPTYCCNYGYMTFADNICPGLTCCSGGPGNVVGTCANGHRVEREPQAHVRESGKNRHCLAGIAHYIGGLVLDSDS